MSIQVALVSQPNFEVHTLLYVSSQVLGRNICETIDSGKVPKNHLGFLTTLAEMQQQGIKNPSELRDHILGHFSFGFLVLIPEYLLHDLFITGLRIISSNPVINNRLMLITDSLDKWRSVITHYSNNQSSIEMRRLLNLILFEFEKLGLESLFSNYKKTTLPDKTFLLELK